MKRVILAFGIAVTWVAILYMTLAPEALAYNFIRGASGGSVAPLWATDQTLQMPYSCARYVWINPSTSPDGATGGGSLSPAQGGTGTGTQSHPFLTLSSLYATNGDVPVDAGTCINIVNSAPLIDDGDSTYFFWPGYLPAGHRGGDANDPTGYAILRSVDGDGNLVPAAGPGVTPDTVNTNAAHLILSSPTARYLYFATDGAPMGDYWIIDGLNIDAVGAMTTQNFNGCITLGDGNVNNWVPNQPAGPTHMMVRNSYIHGCGGAGIQTGAPTGYLFRTTSLPTILVRPASRNRASVSSSHKPVVRPIL